MRAERGMSAPPEVVFNTATDPARAGWLPDRLRGAAAEVVPGELSVRWRPKTPDTWAGALRVWPNAAGGAHVELEVDADDARDAADQALTELEYVVNDNLTAG